MSDIFAAVKSLLSSDATLAALATNGILDDDDVGRGGLSVDDLISGSNPTIQPTVYINWTTDSESARVIEARRIFFELYFYNHSSYSTIEAMLRRAYDLLHQQRVAVTGNDYIYAFVWSGDILRQIDPDLGEACMARSRYYGDYIRRT